MRVTALRACAAISITTALVLPTQTVGTTNAAANTVAVNAVTSTVTIKNSATGAYLSSPGLTTRSTVRPGRLGHSTAWQVFPVSNDLFRLRSQRSGLCAAPNRTGRAVVTGCASAPILRTVAQSSGGVQLVESTSGRVLTGSGRRITFAAPGAAGQSWQISQATPKFNGASLGDGYATSFSRAMLASDRQFDNGTIRMVVYPTMSGKSTKVTLSNRFGSTPMNLAAVSVARQSSGATPAQRPVPLTFAGQRAVSIPAGQEWTSDAANFPVTAREPLLVSIAVNGIVTEVTQHPMGIETTYFSGGNQADNPDGSIWGYTESIAYILKTLQVTSTANPRTISALGDSITDGAFAGSTKRWNEQLAKRLADRGVTNIGVANAGISGNLVTRDSGAGRAALHRFDDDVVIQPGVSAVFLFEGINDIQTSTPASEIIGAMQIMIDRSRAFGLKVNISTIGPWQGWRTYTEEREAQRQLFNDWVRNSSGADYIADFDRALRDPNNPKAFLPAYDSGDHLHPNESGFAAMANSIDLSRLAY